MYKTLYSPDRIDNGVFSLNLSNVNGLDIVDVFVAYILYKVIVLIAYSFLLY